MGSGVRTGLRLLAVLVVAITLVYSAALIALRLMGFEVSVVVSDSMRPVAARGDLLLSRPAADFRVGEVVVFRRGDIAVMHRLVEHSAAGWRTKGDANPGRDPWLLAAGDITGKAEGVLRGLGFPLLWANSIGGAAGAFTTAQAVPNSVSAAHWTSPTMSWTVYANSSAITRVSPSSVTFGGSGERRIYAATRYSSGSRVFVDGRITAADQVKPEYTVLLNGCVNSSDVISCGWLVSVNNSTKQVTLQTATGNTARSAVISSCSFASAVNLTASHTLAVHKVGSAIYVLVNGVSCLRVLNATGAATDLGIAVPTGSFTGVMLTAANRFEATRLIIW